MKIILLIILFLVLVFILFKKNKNSKESFYNQEKINIVMSCDEKQFVGLVAIVNSILIHTKQKDRLFFNFLVDKNEKDILDKLLKKKLNLQNYNIKEINNDTEMTNNIRVNRDNNIKNVMNFARFNFENEFRKLDKILYLDCDMIVKAPIENLYDKFDNSNYPIAAVKVKSLKNMDDIFYECKKLYNLKDNYPYFNAGVFCTSLNYWRKNGIKRKIIKIMKEHKKSKKGLFRLGTQPILNIVFANNFQILEKTWNTGGLGYKKVSQREINDAKILHWTGKKKPWLQNGMYKEIWNKYKL